MRYLVDAWLAPGCPEIDNNNMIDQIKYYLSNEELRNRIISDAHSLVVKNFSEAAYLTRLQEVFSAVRDGVFKEARWEEGNFTVDRK